MKLQKTSLDGVVLIELDVYPDFRGFFIESYQEEKFKAAGIDYPFVQDNHSHSIQGALRGLHYQLRHPQGKLIRVTCGEIFDVAVDLRRSSETFRKWFGCFLSDENKKMVFIPPGFAHGYYTISDAVDVLYKTTDYYDPESERCILWDDHTLAIEWPLVSGKAPLLSKRDLAGKILDEAEVYP